MAIRLSALGGGGFLPTTIFSIQGISAGESGVVLIVTPPPGKKAALLLLCATGASGESDMRISVGGTELYAGTILARGQTTFGGLKIGLSAGTLNAATSLGNIDIIAGRPNEQITIEKTIGTTGVILNYMIAYGD